MHIFPGDYVVRNIFQIKMSAGYYVLEILFWRDIFQTKKMVHNIFYWTGGPWPETSSEPLDKRERARPVFKFVDRCIYPCVGVGHCGLPCVI